MLRKTDLYPYKVKVKEADKSYMETQGYERRIFEPKSTPTAGDVVTNSSGTHFSWKLDKGT